MHVYKLSLCNEFIVMQLAIHDFISLFEMYFYSHVHFLSINYTDANRVLHATPINNYSFFYRGEN